MIISLKDLLKLHDNNGDDLLVWWITEEDVQAVALRQLGRKINRDELIEVVKGIDCGLGDGWIDVVESAISEITK